MKLTDVDRAVLAAMSTEPGAVRSAWERVAFEHQWDDRVEVGRA